MVRSQEVVDVERLDRLVFHVNVPDLECQIVARENVASITAEFDVRNRRCDLREERLVRGVLFLLKHFLKEKDKKEDKKKR